MPVAFHQAERPFLVGDQHPLQPGSRAASLARWLGLTAGLPPKVRHAFYFFASWRGKGVLLGNQVWCTGVEAGRVAGAAAEGEQKRGAEGKVQLNQKSSFCVGWLGCFLRPSWEGKCVRRGAVLLVRHCGVCAAAQ